MVNSKVKLVSQTEHIIGNRPNGPDLIICNSDGKIFDIGDAASALITVLGNIIIKEGCKNVKPKRP